MKPWSSRALAMVAAGVVLFAFVSSADNDVARRSRGDLLKAHQYETFGDLGLFVDPTGNDANSCTSSGADACLTIQGALNRSAKMLRHRPTITAACGNYSGAYVTGFYQDQSVQQTTAYPLIQGTMGNSTNLATGNATGTVTSATHVGAHDPWDTVTDATETWTVNDLTGKYIVFTSGTNSGQTLAIDSNTATTITVVSKFFSTPDATSHYAIQEPCSVITTCVTKPPLSATLSGGSANYAAFVVVGNNLGAATIRNFKVTAACSLGVSVWPGIGSLTLDTLEFVTGVTGNRIGSVNGGSSITATRISSTTSSTTLTHIVFPAVTGNAINQSYLAGGKTGIQESGVSTSISQVSVANIQSFGVMVNGAVRATINDTHVACAANGTDGGAAVSRSAGYTFLNVGNTAADVVNSPPNGNGARLFNNDRVTSCDIWAVVGAPGAYADVVEGNGATSSIGFDVWNGGATRWNAATNITSPLEVVLEHASDEVTPVNAFTRASVAGGDCNMTLNYGSRACARL